MISTILVKLCNPELPVCIVVLPYMVIHYCVNDMANDGLLIVTVTYKDTIRAHKLLIVTVIYDGST